MRWVLIGVCFLLPTRAQENNRVIPVCDALQNRIQLNDQTLRIRGVLRSSDEGTWLASPEQCEPLIVTGDYNWGGLIWITAAGSYDVQSAPFEQDLENKKLFRQLVADQGADASKRITVTIVGRFETFTDLTRRVSINRVGERVYLGYGHLNLALARIIIKSFSLTDVVVE
jgi:hypothetical protein